VKWISNSGGS